MIDNNDEVAMLQEVLGISLPNSYREFLRTEGSGSVYGLPLLGLPNSLELDSAWGATEFLRALRPDLDPVYSVVRLMDSRALCLDLRAGRKDDAPLVEIDLDQPSPPRPLHISFHSYLMKGERDKRQIAGGLRRIEWHLKNARKSYDHAQRGSSPPFRAHDWRVIRSCVHDQVVGLTALRHNETFNGQEIDVFLTADHPDYQPGHGVRALMMLILSDAYRNGASMELRFTRHHGQQNRRVPDRLPPALLSLSSELGLSFQQADSGIVSHDETVNLFAAILGLTSSLRKRIEEIQESNTFSVQGLCYLLSTRLWTLEEATWILLNCPRAEALLFGLDLPEDRLGYLESLSYGRAALSATKLCQKLQLTPDSHEGDSSVQVEGLTWQIETANDAVLDWVVGAEPETLKNGDRVAVLPRPRPILPSEHERILADAATLGACIRDNRKKFLLYSHELSDRGDLIGIANELNRTSGIKILRLPIKTHELNLEVDRRMARARILRT